jgi:transposase-like protein
LGVPCVPTSLPCHRAPAARAPGSEGGGRPATTQRFRCHDCRRTFTARTGTPLAGHCWPLEVITTAVRWHCGYRPSAADVRDLLAERRSGVSARTVLAWAHTFDALLATEGRRRARSVGVRWRVDETSVRVAGRWAYLCRAVDESGQVVDVLMRAQRDLVSARACFDQAIARRGSGGTKGPRVQAARSYTWWRPPSTGRTRIGPVGERDVGRGVSSCRVRWGRWRLS